MRKNKALNLIVFAFIMLMCSSCADVPENVKNDMSQYNGQADIFMNQNEYQYIDVSDIAEDFKSALEGEYGQFEVSKEIIIPNSENICTMEFEYVDNFHENADEIFKIFFDDEVLKKQTIIDDDSMQRMVTREFYNKQDKVYCCVGNNGFTAMLLPSAFDNSFSRSSTVIKTYHIDRNEISEDAYTLSDGECTVKEAVNFVNDWLNTKWKPFESYYDFSVKTVMVRELKEKCYFDFVVEKYYNGIPLDEISDSVMSEDENGCPYVKHTFSSIRINMMNCCEISSFTSLNGIIKPIQSASVNSILSLESALKLCQSTFSDFKAMIISDINIKYSLLPQYNYLGEEITYGNVIIINSAESDTQAGVKVLSRPVWEIIIDVPSSEYGTSSEFNQYGDIKKYICIDVQTGEIYYRLSLSEVLKFAK